MPNSLRPYRLYSPRNPPGRNTGVGICSLLQGIFPTQISCTGGRFLLAESREKPKNTGVSSLSLLQQIFLIHESNQGLLHCRWILYQLSYQGSQGFNHRLIYQSSFLTYNSDAGYRMLGAGALG